MTQRSSFGIYVFTVLMICMFGCDSARGAEVSAGNPVKAKPGTNAEPDSEVAKKIKSLEEQLELLQFRIKFLEDWKGRFPEESAVLDTASKNFVQMMSEGAVLLASIESIEPYLDGLKVRLSIGNTTAASMSHYKLYVTWWKRPPADAVFGILTGRHSGGLKIFEPIETLKAGAWTTIEVLIPAVKPEDFGVMDVQITSIGTESLTRY